MKPTLRRGLYAITDCVNLDTSEMLSKSELILQAGISVLQYRDKTTYTSRRIERAVGLQTLCKKYNTIFIINDDIRLARQINADGVHIGEDDADYHESRKLLGPDAIVGVSCYDKMELALLAERRGADYVAFGSFYSTSTKETIYNAGLELLTEAGYQLVIPVVAIGGITPENGLVLLKAGADMLAVVSSLYSSNDPKRVVSKFNALFKQTEPSE